MKWMAFAYPSEPKRYALYNTMNFYGFCCVLRTAWIKPAVTTNEKAESQLIESNQREDNFFNHEQRTCTFFPAWSREEQAGPTILRLLSF
jgi:hypothetical protein